MANHVKGDWLKPGAVVIDVGINYIPGNSINITSNCLDATKKGGQRLVGDVDYDSAVDTASMITPVPGGVGPMTICSALQNVFIAAKRFYEESVSRKIEPLPIKILQPVPSDIHVARAAMPKHVKTLAHEVGILEHELELYGRYKAKVSLDVMKRIGHRRDGRYVFVTGFTSCHDFEY
jgi:methylenetetrahydrofolate dehydrogenase (NADP+) / methenyltetrahydrofolate cyclohydrolase / formyltetrahydrofolate synthetase